MKRLLPAEVVIRPDFGSDRLNRAEAAQYLGLAVGTLEVDACTRKLGIAYYKVGRKPYYRRSDLDRWLEARRVEPKAVK